MPTPGTVGDVLIKIERSPLMRGQNVASQLKHAGETVSRCGLVIVLSWGWVVSMNFDSTEFVPGPLGLEGR